MTTPQVSVIIPTYNRASLIGETLNSVLGQTLEDWECLVIDDGSSDNTQTVVEALCAREPRFRYVRQEASDAHRDHKVILARNRGAALAHGEFIAFLDDDDVWLPRYMEETVGLLRRHPDAVLSAAPRLYWDGERVLEEQRFRPDQISQPLHAMIRHCYLVPSLCIIRQDFLRRTEMFRQPGAEDMDLWLQLLPLGPPAFATEPLVLYRVHPAGSQVDADGSRRRTMTERQIETLHRLLKRRDISLFDRLLTLSNIQRKHEQLLDLDIRQGHIPQSRLARLRRLLNIFPTPLLRSPSLAVRYLAYKSS